MAVNYPAQKLQNKLVKKHAPAELIISATLFATGAIVGILEAMTNKIIAIIPAALGKYIHVIFELCIVTDAHFYGIMPLVIHVCKTYGLAPFLTANALKRGDNTPVIML